MSNVEKKRVRIESSQNFEPPLALSSSLSSSSTILLSPSSKKKFITNLDVAITKFSDGNLFVNNGKTKTSIIEENILKRFSPTGLEDQFKQLYSIIYSFLYRPSKSRTSTVTTNSSFLNISSSSAAILMGAKGSGKSLLLERVLLACREQKNNQQKCNSGILYRRVTINGIGCRGQDVSSVVYEIIRQLSEIAFQSATTIILNKQDNNDDGSRIKEIEEQKVNRKRRKRDKDMLRLRKSAFTSNLALLNSSLEIADADGIPVLLVLDELDSFTEEGERQMLLYYFLDRVATPGSNLILVGITSSFSALTLLEKRIRSRAEGTAKIIYMYTAQNYQDLLQIMAHKLKGCLVGTDIIEHMSRHNSKFRVQVLSNREKGDDGGTMKSSTVQQVTKMKALDEVNKVSNRDNLGTKSNDEIDMEETFKLSVTLEREFRLGKDIRWFSRVIAVSLMLYRHNCISVTPNNKRMEGLILNFRSKFIRDALVMMGASMFDNVAGSKQPDFCIVNGIAVSCRLQALLDLSTPQVCLILSARRILAREGHREKVVTAPLTMERMIKEYESFRRESTSSIGNFKLLKQAAYHLMEQGLLVPSMDHSGGGPMQYHVTKIYRNLDSYRILRLPIQIPLDVDRELGKALDLNILECPASLKEWGKSIK